MTITNTTLVLYTWGIELTDNKEELTVKDELCKGCIHYSERKIYLDKNLSLPDLYIVMRHELTHAVLYETQIELKESYTEEDMCEFVGKYGKLISSKVDEIIEIIIKNFDNKTE